MTDDEIKAVRTIYNRGYTVTAANDIPALLDEIERLRGVVADLRLAEAEAMALVMNHEGHIERLRAENERLRTSKEKT